MASKKTYTVTVQYNENTEEYYITLPEKLLKQMKWKTGDNIDWTVNRDGSFTLNKV